MDTQEYRFTARVQAFFKVAWVSTAVLIGSNPTLWAHEVAECVNQPPLIEYKLDTLHTWNELGPKYLGGWYLPNSPTNGALTYARVDLYLVPSQKHKGLWKIRMDFTYDDPMPYGIPYSFQKAELFWSDPTGDYLLSIDWSKSCSELGPTFFPQQSFQQSFEEHYLDSPHAPVDLTFRLWGSRN